MFKLCALLLCLVAFSTAKPSGVFGPFGHPAFGPAPVTFGPAPVAFAAPVALPAPVVTTGYSINSHSVHHAVAVPAPPPPPAIFSAPVALPAHLPLPAAPVAVSPPVLPARIATPFGFATPLHAPLAAAPYYGSFLPRYPTPGRIIF